MRDCPRCASKLSSRSSGCWEEPGVALLSVRYFYGPGSTLQYSNHFHCTAHDNKGLALKICEQSLCTHGSCSGLLDKRGLSMLSNQNTATATCDGVKKAQRKQIKLSTQYAEQRKGIVLQHTIKVLVRDRKKILSNKNEGTAERLGY